MFASEHSTDVDASQLRGSLLGLPHMLRSEVRRCSLARGPFACLFALPNFQAMKGIVSGCVRAAKKKRRARGGLSPTCGGTLSWVFINISMEGHVPGGVMIPIAVLCVCVYSWLEKLASVNFAYRLLF